VLAHFAPLGGPFIFASRFVASFQVGRVPFYDLAQGGVFEPQYLLGGENGVRGVPQGRYAGRVKMVANTEIRATPFPRFRLLGQRLRIGTTAFFDAGRTWSDYQVTSPADGTSLGLKYGVGAGVFLQWGEAAIFRVDVAYSPDAESENPGFPLGIYVSDGLMF
jgi:outer membrane protein assembly factor BamA